MAMKIKSVPKPINIVHMENLAYVFFMPILIGLFNVVINQFGLGSASSMTKFVYIASLIVLLCRVRKNLLKSDLLILFAIYFIIAVSYVLFSDTRELLIGINMLIIYVFFIPICVFSIRKIKDWSLFFFVLRKIGVIAVAMAAFILIFLDYEKYLIYMGFSYTILPFIAALYRAFREERKVIDIIMFIIGTVSIFVFGARAAILFLTLYIVLYEITRADKNLQFKIITTIVISLASVTINLNADNIITALSRLSSFDNSRFLTQLIKGSLFESKSRDVLYEVCINRINTMGLEVTGFLGDRAYCTGYAYPHNFVYEILMSWGWIFGVLILLWMLWLFVKCLVHRDAMRREIALFMIITGFARYMISGSYLIEGKFWIMLFAMIALSKGWNKIRKFKQEA
jgi:hypothetical protein